MQWGTSGFTLPRRSFLFFLVTFLITAGVLAAQQPSSPSSAEQPATPSAAIPAAQPVPQARQNPTSEASPPDKTGDANKPSESTQVRLGPGDLIEVSVYNVSELNSKVRISDRGDIYLPLINYVHVDGLTQEEAQTLIEKRLSDGGFVRSPHVSIFVDDALSQGVTLIGEVAKPGIYPDVADRKLYEVVSEAGGFTQAASRKIAILRRNQAEPIRIDLPRNLADDTSGNVDIQPGDTITVPRAPIIYVVGDVGRPSGLLVDNGALTVLQALALAGGTNHTAKLGATRIIRKGPNGVMTETKVEVKKMLEAKVPDVTLHADDILFVPVSGAKVAAGKTIDVATTAAAAVLVYSVHP
jgi:polysaccharide biosynthesis/export protein